MKKYLLIISLVFLNMAASAQTNNAKTDSLKTMNIKFGVLAGLTVSNLSYEGNDDINFSGRTNFTGGVMAEIPVYGKLYFQPEVLYAAQGAKLKYNDPELENTHYEGTLKLNYLNVPLKLKYFVTEGLSVQAGPQLGFLLKSENSYSDNFLGFDYSDDYDLSDVTKNFDFALSFGAGYQYLNKYYLDIRYNLSFTDVFENNQDFANNNMKNKVFQVTVGYYFN